MAILLDADSGAVLSRRVRRAWLPWTRTLGFLGRRHIPPDEGLWFPRCRAVHTIGMRAAIDVMFLNREGQIVKIESPAPLGTPVLRAPGATAVLECGSGFIAASGIAVGHRLMLA